MTNGTLVYISCDQRDSCGQREEADLYTCGQRVKASLMSGQGNNDEDNDVINVTHDDITVQEAGSINLQAHPDGGGPGTATANGMEERGNVNVNPDPNADAGAQGQASLEAGDGQEGQLEISNVKSDAGELPWNLSQISY